LPAIQSRRGRSPAFSPGDAVALSILRVLTEDWGIQIGHLGQISTELFRLCNATPWVVLEAGTLAVNVAEGSCSLLRSAAGVKNDRSILLCPLSSIMNQLREDFLQTESSTTQRELLPPTVIKQRTSGAKT
jgi:hypothetical protein